MFRFTSKSSLAPPSDLAGDFLPPPVDGVRTPPDSGVWRPEPPPVEFRSFLRGEPPGSLVFGTFLLGGEDLTSGLISSNGVLVDLPRNPRFLTGIDFSAKIKSFKFYEFKTTWGFFFLKIFLNVCASSNSCLWQYS